MLCVVQDELAAALESPEPEDSGADTAEGRAAANSTDLMNYSKSSKIFQEGLYSPTFVEILTISSSQFAIILESSSHKVLSSGACQLRDRINSRIILCDVVLYK